MRVVMIGCVESSAIALEELLSSPEVELTGIVTRDRSPDNADFLTLVPVARELGIPHLIYHGCEKNFNLAEWIREREPDLIVCIGWSYLLPSEILSIPRIGVVGYHPAGLPRHRGRHPIIWALVLGLEKSASTLFLMDEGADSGPILDQTVVEIGPEDDARILYDKMMVAMREQLRQQLPLLASGKAVVESQDESKASYLRKRTVLDGEIDWRMSSGAIYNLVRALSEPYPGAYCLYRGYEVKILKVKKLAVKEGVEEPGKVLVSDKKSIVVKCGDGAIEILRHGFEPSPQVGEYL